MVQAEQASEEIIKIIDKMAIERRSSYVNSNKSNTGSTSNADDDNNEEVILF